MLFRPTRQKAMDKARVLVDLDRLVSEPQVFRFGGKNHVVKPIDNQTFLALSAKLARIQNLIAQDAIDDEGLTEAYIECFATVCDTIKKRDVEKMTLAQRGSLLQFVVDCIRGRAQSEDLEKKRR